MLSLGMWENKLEEVEPLSDIERLPSYGFLFFFRHMGPFARPFWLLTVCCVTSTLLRFVTVYLLGNIVSHAAEISIEKVFSFYLPAWLGASVGAEFLDFFIRKYGEALPAVYRDYVTLRFYLTVLELDPRKLFNFSKERLSSLIGRYAAGAQSF